MNFGLTMSGNYSPDSLEKIAKRRLFLERRVDTGFPISGVAEFFY